jgi:hypothetical protein
MPAAFWLQEDSWYSIFVRGWVHPRAIVQLEGLGQLKNPWPHRESNPRSLRKYTLQVLRQRGGNVNVQLHLRGVRNSARADSNCWQSSRELSDGVRYIDMWGRIFLKSETSSWPIHLEDYEEEEEEEEEERFIWTGTDLSENPSFTKEDPRTQKSSPVDPTYPVFFSSL